MNAQAPNTGLSQFSNLQFFYSNILSLIEHSEIYLTTNLGVHLNPNFRESGLLQLQQPGDNFLIQNQVYEKLSL